jgi:hypothetical protein
VTPEPIPVRSGARLADRAFVLPVVAFFLLTPPILSIFNAPVPVFGIPLLHIYCFAVWLIAIAFGGWLAHRMVAGSEAPDSGAEPNERS